MKKQKGITLVALVISIIVLLILATVSINLVINNGILDKAKTAVDKYSDEEELEKIKLAVFSSQLAGTGIITTDNLTNELKKTFNNNEKATEIQAGWKYKAKYTYKIYKNGKVEVTDLLPDDYYRVEYIETKGIEYIDTEYVFKNKPKIVGEIMITSSADLDIMGNSNAKLGCFIIDFSANTLYYRYSSSNRKDINTGIEVNKWYNFEFSDKVKVNGIEKGTIDSYDFSSNDQTFYIGRGRNCGCARFKDIKMYDGDTLVRDLVPYYKKEGNKVGMYDKVNNVFYTNQGASADFKVGPQK